MNGDNHLGRQHNLFQELYGIYHQIVSDCNLLKLAKTERESEIVSVVQPCQNVHILKGLLPFLAHEQETVRS